VDLEGDQAGDATTADADATAPRRRRGAALEAALLEAAWRELVERGYAAMSMDSVAHRAGTSRPVLYRRWSSKQDLVRAAVVHEVRREPAPGFDTGSLRSDLVEMLTYANGTRAIRGAMLTSYLGGYFQETGTNLVDIRASLIGDGRTTLDDAIDRAIERGEIDPSTMTRRRRTLAFDLFRHEVLMTLQPVPDEVIAEIVDDIVLPLLTGHGPRT
jgi:AcrR family transcriptional regulator